MSITDFGVSLRRWRERMTPEAAGLPAGGRRRATGLRREEVAQLAGVSVDYVTRLEQGRASSPSAQVVESLARALRLAPAERTYLYRLAGQSPPDLELVPTHLTASVQRLLDRLSGVPVVVYDAAWTLVVANVPFAALMGDPSAWVGRERNAVWRNLVGSGSRAVYTPEERAALEAALVGDLRRAAADYPADRQVRKLIADLGAASERFVELWESGEVTAHLGTRKIIDHPTVGRITLDCDTLTLSPGGLRIMVYTADPGSADAERLALATVLGTQAFVG